ncbi:MAG: hypothetical protein Q8L68_04600, partial [Methylococcales bacterium]|nr:hypothetical protein [Methylococcales bacterium]
ALKKTDRLLKRYRRYRKNTHPLDDLKEDARRILNDFAQISPDPATARYITETFRQIEVETNSITLLKLRDDLKTLATQLKKVRQSLDEILKSSPKPNFFNPFRKKEPPSEKATIQSRADKIKQAFQALPPLDRIQIFSRSTSPIRAFTEALDADGGDSHSKIYRQFKAIYPQSIYVPQSEDEEEEDTLAIPRR